MKLSSILDLFCLTLLVTGLIAALPSQAKDTSENGLDGKLEGKVKVVDGKFGEALQFDGNSYVEIPFNELLNIKHMTLICWVNAEKAAAVQIHRWKPPAYTLEIYQT